MKAITSLIFAIALILYGLAGTEAGKCQTVAIGHVCAEVIESVSASTQAVTDLSIATAGSGASKVDLGVMTVDSGSSVAVNVVVKSATLSDSQGNGFTLDPIINNNKLASVASSNGSQTIQLNGTANLAADQAPGLYQGSYTVVFAYN